MARILVVDDHVPSRNFLVNLLGYQGHQLLEAADGAEGLLRVRADRPDLIISDILMPTMDGYEFVRQLRADPEIRSTNVVFWTATYHLREANALAEACGVLFTICKPAEPEKVLEIVQAALGQAQSSARVSLDDKFDREHLRLVTDKLETKLAELEEIRDQNSAILAVVQELASEEIPILLFDKLCQAARKLTAARYAVAGLWQSGQPTLQSVCAAGFDSKTKNQLDAPPAGEGLLAQLFRDSHPLRTRDSGSDPLTMGLPPPHRLARSFLGVPLCARGQVYGALYLIEKLGHDNFSDQDEKVVVSLAAQATVSYQNQQRLEQLQRDSYYDTLTGLPNRLLLQDRLAKALASARRRKDKVGVLFLDLDRFKNINDSLGHSVGDLFLQNVAERLKTWGREQDTVARLGGDEFLIMLTQLKDAPDAAVAAERLMDTLVPEFVVQGHALSVNCSIGISMFPEHGKDSETLIKNADAAMYDAKENGRNNFRFFTADMNAQAVERLTLENSLRFALDKKELFLMYQPQMDITSGKIVGLEALIRWQHPELGLVPPDKFTRIAENSGLIMPIGEWVLRTACAQARQWKDEGLLAGTVAVNVSAVQFRQEGFCEHIRSVLQETRLAPHYLELELTESLLLANADVTLSVIQGLKAMGLALAIDDFGTGYSSFSYLRQFRVSKLKIDRSFIRDVAVNPDDAAITSAIISMAKSLKLKVIAEGVEDEAQMSFLRAHQCDEIQGYYFSKPLTIEKVADKLRGENSDPLARAQTNVAQS